MQSTHSVFASCTYGMFRVTHLNTVTISIFAKCFVKLPHSLNIYNNQCCYTCLSVFGNEHTCAFEGGALRKGVTTISSCQVRFVWAYFQKTVVHSDLSVSGTHRTKCMCTLSLLIGSLNFDIDKRY